MAHRKSSKKVPDVLSAAYLEHTSSKVSPFTKTNDMHHLFDAPSYKHLITNPLIPYTPHTTAIPIYRVNYSNV